MRLLEIADLPTIAEPWREGDNIPWYEPGFSQRMLDEHLRQDHDAASRRFEKIDEHVCWIQQLLDGQPGKILDLCCGPGLYTHRLARLGNCCVGIDYSPASIAYARKIAQSENLDCTYFQHDIRMAEYGTGFRLVLLIYGELNVFCPNDAKAILRKAHQALIEGGILLLEPHTFTAVQKKGEKKPSWYFAESGLFSDQPHLCLEQHFWDAEQTAATTRYLIIDANTGVVTPHALSVQAYTHAQYHQLLIECGFSGVQFFPALIGTEDTTQPDMMGIVAKKAW